ncbi:MAG: hypothetical protein DI547_07495 [Sphingobium sp.]|nr:MAG: hypothetical protein DI547_07495 [Sphingobium sp.]
MNDINREDAAIAAAAREKAARQRFLALGLFRLSGAFIVMFGFLILMRRFDWVQGDKAKWLGMIITLVGLFQFVIVPRLLMSAWRSPRDK